jgi:hypothetical protein
MKFPGFHKKKLILDKNNKTIWPWMVKNNLSFEGTFVQINLVFHEMPSKPLWQWHLRSFPCVCCVCGFYENGFHISQCHDEVFPICALSIMALPVLLQNGYWDCLWAIWFYLVSPKVQQLDVIWLSTT